MERKTFRFELKSLDEAGIFEGYGSVFGVRDDVNDIVEKGAFRKTLLERAHRIKIFYQHDVFLPIGKPVELREDDVGLYIKGQLALKTFWGKETYELMKAGVMSELSIGYDPILATVDGDGVRHLKELKLYDVSPVAIAAHPSAIVTMVKSKIGSEDQAAATGIEGKPFAGYEDFDDCVRQNQDKDDPEAFCAWLENQTTKEWPEGVSSDVVARAIRFKEAVEGRGQYEEPVRLRDQIAQEMFGKPFGELTDAEKWQVHDEATTRRGNGETSQGGQPSEDSHSDQVEIGITVAMKAIDTARIELKEGRVLSKRNKDLIEQAVEALQALLEAADQVEKSALAGDIAALRQRAKILEAEIMLQRVT